MQPRQTDCVMRIGSRRQKQGCLLETKFVIHLSQNIILAHVLAQMNDELGL